MIEAICKPYGRLVRIVVFKKAATQALVEFDSVDSARDAKEALHGADIYSNCCTLRIEFGKVRAFTALVMR